MADDEVVAADEVVAIGWGGVWCVDDDVFEFIIFLFFIFTFNLQAIDL